MGAGDSLLVYDVHTCVISNHPSDYILTQFGGNDILHVYNRQQVKHRFSVGGLYIANTKPGGFTMEVHNLIPGTTVMVGIRMMVGCRSLERAPSSAEIFGRTHPVSACMGATIICLEGL